MMKYKTLLIVNIVLLVGSCGQAQCFFGFTKRQPVNIDYLILGRLMPIVAIPCTLGIAAMCLDIVWEKRAVRQAKHAFIMLFSRDPEAWELRYFMKYYAKQKQSLSSREAAKKAFLRYMYLQQTIESLQKTRDSLLTTAKGKF